MKVLFNSIMFKSHSKTFNKGENKITEYYDDNNVLTKTLEVDKFERFVDAKEYSKTGEITSHMHKKYEDEKVTEIYKDRFQEYTRITRFVKKGEFTHRIEEYISKTSPENNYVHEFIRDCADKLVKMICNGKIIDLVK